MLLTLLVQGQKSSLSFQGSGTRWRSVPTGRAKRVQRLICRTPVQCPTPTNQHIPHKTSPWHCHEPKRPRVCAKHISYSHAHLITTTTSSSIVTPTSGIGNDRSHATIDLRGTRRDDCQGTVKNAIVCRYFTPTTPQLSFPHTQSYLFPSLDLSIRHHM